MSGGGRKIPSPPAPRADEREEESETHGAPTVRHVAVTRAFLAKVPRVILAREELNVADLDHREYFLIALMDETTTVENLLDISGMMDDEALALLDSLARRGIIEVDR
jgi:hypothetical protein